MPNETAIRRIFSWCINQRFNHNESLIFQWPIDSSIRFYLDSETRHNMRIENGDFTIFWCVISLRRTCICQHSVLGPDIDVVTAKESSEIQECLKFYIIHIYMFQQSFRVEMYKIFKLFIQSYSCVNMWCQYVVLWWYRYSWNCLMHF